MNYREAEMEQQVQTATGSDLQEMLERGHSLLYSGNPKAKGSKLCFKEIWTNSPSVCRPLFVLL